MQYRESKKNGDSLSVLGMGCMRFPGSMGVIDRDKTEKIILSAFEKGINYFDTAYIYPGSEEALGLILEKNGLREKCFLATKLPQSKCKTADDFDRFFLEQKKRLRTDYIDYYLMHNVTSFSQWDRLKALGIEKWLKEKKQSGEIRRIGFSYHGPSKEFEPLLNDYDWDFVQIQYNYININYQAGQAGLRAAAKKGLPVIIMEPLLGGKLAANLPKSVQKIFSQADPNISAAEWALGWLWNQPEVTVVLSGMNRPEQLEENAALTDKIYPETLPQERDKVILAAIETFEKLNKLPCAGCNYCMPCPKRINIPGCFASYNVSYAMGWYTGAKHYFLNTGLVSVTPHYPRHCIGCGQCEKNCPQGIQIRRELKKVTRRFEKPGVRTIAWFVRRFFNKNKKKNKKGN